MCLLCVEIQKNSMTYREIAKAYVEYEFENDHEFEVMELIYKNHGLDGLNTTIDAIVNEQNERVDK